MKSGAPAFGTPEYMKTAIVGGQLARRLGLPYRSSNANAANSLDAQAAYESVFSLWGAVMGGVNFLMHGAGWMEGGLQASFEKMVLDADLLAMVAEFLRPMRVEDEELALDAMREVGPGGHFFGAEHTQSRYRTAFFRADDLRLAQLRDLARGRIADRRGRRRAYRRPASARLRAAALRAGAARGAGGVRRPPQGRGRRARPISEAGQWPYAPSMHATVAGVFFAFGVGIGLWGGASGAILTRAGVDAGAFGVILTVYTAIYLIAMSAGGSLAHRFGARKVVAISAIAFGAALCALLDARTVFVVAGALIASGFVGGVVDVTMNAEGARIERRLGRPILARLHACASAGMAIGAVAGSLIVVSAAPWAAGVVAAIGLVAAGFAYERASRSESELRPRCGVAARPLLRARPDRARNCHRGLDCGGDCGFALVDAAAAGRSAEACRDRRPRRGVLLRLSGDPSVQCRFHPPQIERSAHHRRDPLRSPPPGSLPWPPRRICR